MSVALILLVALRALVDALRAGDLVRAGAGATFLVLLLHSGMDFDWTYPALLSLAALVGVLALPVPAQVDVPLVSRTRQLGGGHGPSPRRGRDRRLAGRAAAQRGAAGRMNPRQIGVRWKFWNDRDGVGPRWPW